MKHIKEYNEYIDPFKEDDWDEVEPIEPDEIIETDRLKFFKDKQGLVFIRPNGVKISLYELPRH